MVDAVLDQRFGNSRRTSAKRWVNAQIAKIWASEDWAFKRPPLASAAVPVDALGVYSVTITDSTQEAQSIEEILGVFDENGDPLEALENDKFEQLYNDADPGTPEAFTVYGTDANLRVVLGPPPDEAKTWKTAYSLGAPTLVNDAADLSDYGWPAIHHEVVVVAARIQGLRDENDGTWRELSPEKKELLDAMKDRLLIDTSGETREFGADQLGAARL